MFDMRLSTLQDFAKRTHLTPFQGTCPELGRKPCVPPELVEKLVSYLSTMEKVFYGCPRNNIEIMAYKQVVENKVKTLFKPDEAGLSLVDLFLNRHN